MSGSHLRADALASVASTGPTQNLKLSLLFAMPILVLTLAASAHACDAGYKDYYGRCVEAKPASAKLVKFLKDYGRKIEKTGDMADLFAPDVPLFDTTGPGRKIIYTWQRPSADIESEARVEKVLADFYEVTVSVYHGPTSCGIDEFRLKGPKATLRGYVPRTNPQGVPSLWKFRHMTGLC